MYRLRAGAYSVSGACVGALVGGPVGLCVGAKAGALAAAAGSLLGYVGVRMLGRRATTNTEIADTSAETTTDTVKSKDQ